MTIQEYYDRIAMKVLVVDDAEVNRDILTDILTDAGYEAVTAENGIQALEMLEENYPGYDVVLLDLVMPELDGFSVLSKMRDRDWLKDIPVIVISGERDREAEKKSLDMGATDFISKPFDEYIVIRRVKNTAELFSYKRSLELQVEQQTRKLKEQSQRIEENNKEIIDILGTVVEFRNLESGQHIKRVKEFTHILAQEMMELFPDCGLTPERVELIASASPLHDIGKITISDAILLKTERLSSEEFEQMKEHTTSGGEILQSISNAWDEDYQKISYEICRSHHERYDGRGYPDGLRGEEIPLSAQLVSVADVYDALVSPRAYKEPFPPDVAYEMIVSGQCGMFSPRILECFRQVRERFEEQKGRG